jgi:hypothetical protein
MSEQTSAGVDKVRVLVNAHAQACLADLTQAACAPRPEVGAQSGGGWRLLLIATPAPAAAEAHELTECDRDCLVLLAQAPGSLSAVRVRRELERRKIGIHGLSTVKRSLAKLRLRLGLIGNSRRAPRGYYLPANSPLFRNASHG